MPRDNSIRGIRILLQSASSSRAFHHTVRNPLPNQSKPRVNVSNSATEVNAESAARRCQVIVGSYLRPRKGRLRAKVVVSIFSSSSLSPSPVFPRPYVTPPSTTFRAHTLFFFFFLLVCLSRFFLFYSPYTLRFSLSLFFFFFGTCREEMLFQRNKVFRGSKVISLVQSKLSDFREPRRRNLPHRLLLSGATLSLSRRLTPGPRRWNPKCDEDYPVSRDPRLLGHLKKRPV